MSVVARIGAEMPVDFSDGDAARLLVQRHGVEYEVARRFVTAVRLALEDLLAEPWHGRRPDRGDFCIAADAIAARAWRVLGRATFIEPEEIEAALDAMCDVGTLVEHKARKAKGRSPRERAAHLGFTNHPCTQAPKHPRGNHDRR